MQARETLVRVASRLFVELGYDAVGVQEIVTEAGVTKPTLYHHFRNKRGLLDEVARRTEASISRVLDGLVGSAGYRGDLPHDLEELIEALLRFAREDPIAMRLMLAAQNGPSESEARLAFRPLWTGLSEEVERFFASAAGDHGNMAGRETEYTVSLLGIVLAYAVQLLDGRLTPQPDRAHRIMRQFSYGIYS
ncbi:MAG: TetR/AcrR family transcriptional regulator [Spirochaetota bacterium]